MKSLFVAGDHREILQRLERLQASAHRQWGKMDPAQALAHCAVAMEMATGDLPRKQLLIGKLLGPFFKSSFLGRLSGDEWGVMMYKHLDHNLRQFGQ